MEIIPAVIFSEVIENKVNSYKYQTEKSTQKSRLLKRLEQKLFDSFVASCDFCESVISGVAFYGHFKTHAEFVFANDFSVFDFAKERAVFVNNFYFVFTIRFYRKAKGFARPFAKKVV